MAGTCGELDTGNYRQFVRVRGDSYCDSIDKLCFTWQDNGPRHSPKQPVPRGLPVYAKVRGSNVFAYGTRFADATEMQKPARCANCEAQAASRYCPNCGQQQSGRLTLRQLGGDFAARFFSAERGLWKTFAELTARPGLTARNYLAGKRRTYVTPLFWYALCAAAQLFHIWLLGDAVPRLLTDNLPPEYFEFLSSQGIDSPKQWAGDRYVTLLQSSYTWLGLVTFVLPTAIVLRVIAGSRINLAESLVVSLLIIGHVMLITAVTGQVLMRVSPLWHGYVSYAIYFIYAVLTVGGCFRWNWRYVLAGSVAILVGGLCFFSTLITLTVTVLNPAF